MRVTATVAAAVVAVAVLAAGCGGGGKKAYALSKQEYASALNAICTDVNTKVKTLDLSSMATFATNGDSAVSVIQDATDQAKKLTPPDDLKDAAAQFNKAAEDSVSAVKDAVKAAKDGDQAKFEAATTSGQEADGRQNDAAKEIGANDCVN